MGFSQSPENNKRIKILLSMLGSYGITFIVLHFFFVNMTPGLNQNAFMDVQKELSSFNLSIPRLFHQPPAETQINGNVPELQPTISQIAPQPTAQQFVQLEQPSVTATPRNTVPTVTAASNTPVPTLQPNPTAVPTQKSANVSYADFGTCLKNNGMVMYRTSTCGLCAQQEKTLKDAYNYIRSVDCNENQANGLECSQVGVRGLPTWAKNGKAVVSGPQTLAQLAELSGCQAPN